MFQTTLRKLKVKLNLLAYRRLQKKIKYKLQWHGYKVYYVNLRLTSSTCPNCNYKLVSNGYRRLKCIKYDLESNKDTIACSNLLKKLFNNKCRVFGFILNASSTTNDKLSERN